MMKRCLFWNLAAAVMALCLLTGCSAGNSVIAPEVTAVIPAETAAVTEPSEVREEQPEENNTIAATTPEAPAETEHIHDWTETVVAPTCTERGYTQRSCFACGETAQDTFVEPAAHTWSAWETAVQATETSQGEAERSCAGCGKKETRVLPVLMPSHTHAYTETVTAVPTCTQPGIRTFSCLCGDVYTDDIAVLSHTYTSQTVPATCTLRGYDVYTCRECGDSYKDRYTPVTLHSYSQVITKPTCTEGGYTTYTCSGCGDSYMDNKTAAIGHSMIHTVKKPTCTTEGYTLHECCVCKMSYTDTKVAAMGHNLGDWVTATAPTETSEGIARRSCRTCGDVSTKTLDKLPHTHSHTGKITTPAKCLSNGVKTFTCSCGDTYTETVSATGHTWGSWKTTAEPTYSAAGTRQRTCSACKAVETEGIPQLEHSHSMVHIKTKPTCTQEGYTTHKCCKCDYTYVDSWVSANGHAWNQWTTVTPATDIATGLAKRTCSVCAAEDTKILPKDPNAHTHSYGIVVEYVEPGCNSDGYQKKACSCGDIRKEVLPAAHDWQHHHEDEVGHYDVYIVCHCGWRCSAAGDYISRYAGHINSLSADEKWTHSYYDTGVWVVDIPARDWDQCTVCGATK